MTVHLVGAGPGGSGLVTLRAAALLATADVVIYDRLVGDDVLGLVSRDALLIDGGKTVGGAAISQVELNALLIEHGRSRDVVRLKGGDPFVFGRGGEEAAALDAAGIAYEVVPGVSSVAAVPAMAGVPLTMRGLSSSFVVITGHDPSIFDRSGEDDPWLHLAQSASTIVVLMGVAQRREIATRLIESGRATTTPVLVVERGTTTAEVTSRTNLAGLGDLPVVSPATIVIGAVAALDLRSRIRRPLEGWRVIVTRAEDGFGHVADALRELGALPLEFPVLTFDGPADGGAALRSAAARCGDYDWVVCTSATAVQRLFDVLRDARSLGGVKVAAIGPRTAAEFARHGVTCDLVPDDAIAEALLADFPPAVGSQSVLLPRAAVARDVLPDGLAEIGYRVDVVDAYRTVHARVSERQLKQLEGADAVLFASSSAASGFAEIVDERLWPRVVCSIGPITSATARMLGFAVTVESEDHTISGLLSELSRYASARGQAPGEVARG